MTDATVDTDIVGDGWDNVLMKSKKDQHKVSVWLEQTETVWFDGIVENATSQVVTLFSEEHKRRVTIRRDLIAVVVR